MMRRDLDGSWRALAKIPSKADPFVNADGAVILEIG